MCIRDSAGPVARRPQPAKICANCCLKAAIWRRAIVGGRLQGHDIPNMRRSGLAQHFWGGWVMSFRGLKAVLLACSGIGVLLAATADANAGGLAVREQSAWGQGSSFAGVAAGGSLSAMFWNPATMTQIPGIQSESVLSGILPYSANTPTSAAGLGTSLALGGTGNVAHAAIVPSSYYSYQFNDKLWLGLSVNS